MALANLNPPFSNKWIVPAAPLCFVMKSWSQRASSGGAVMMWSILSCICVNPLRHQRSRMLLNFPYRFRNLVHIALCS